MKKIRKKLFIAGAYLLLAAALLAYVSYAAYRINIPATVEMPKAKQMAASINLDYNLIKMATESELSTSSQIVLAKLLPGEDVTSYADDPALATAKGRVLSLSVSNRSKDSIELASGSYIDMDFRIEMREIGPIPLDVIMVDESGNRYTAKSSLLDAEEGAAVTEKLNYGTQTLTFKAADHQEPEFHFGADGLEEFKFYFGWNNDEAPKGGYSYQLQRELSVIEVKVTMIGKPYQIEEFIYEVATPANTSTPSTPSEP